MSFGFRLRVEELALLKVWGWRSASKWQSMVSGLERAAAKERQLQEMY